MSFTYAYARPALTVDAVVFASDASGSLKVLLIRRAKEPFKGKWALPGGFLDVGESPEHAVARELAEETGLKVEKLTQLGAYGDPLRDPREHVVSIAFFAITRIDAHTPVAADDASDAAWHALDVLPPLAFDHALIVADALARIQADAAR